MSDNQLTDMTAVRAYIEAEIQKFLPHVGNSKEQVDKYLKHKLFALIDALEMTNEAADPAEFGQNIKRMYQARKGAAESLHGILKQLGVKHRYP